MTACISDDHIILLYFTQKLLYKIKEPVLHNLFYFRLIAKHEMCLEIKVNIPFVLVSEVPVGRRVEVIILLIENTGNITEICVCILTLGSYDCETKAF